MACILLDVDGVLHVSGEPIPGAAEAVARLRRQGHSLRFVTNNSTRPRTTLAEELRTLGFELDDDELQTTARAAARELAGKRVFALVMGAIVPDLEGIELVGDHADAVLLGGCDETTEPNQVFSWMNLGRAFAVFGMYWDISLHIDDGRDAGPLANPAHYFILFGLFGVFAAGLLSMALPERREPARGRADHRRTGTRRSAAC